MMLQLFPSEDISQAKLFIRRIGEIIELENRRTNPEHLNSIESLDILFEIANIINGTSVVLFKEGE